MAEKAGGNLNTERAVTVSYRNRWWSRRYYALRTYDHREALKFAGRLRNLGYQRVRVEMD